MVFLDFDLVFTKSKNSFDWVNTPAMTNILQQPHKIILEGWVGLYG